MLLHKSTHDMSRHGSVNYAGRGGRPLWIVMTNPDLSRCHVGIVVLQPVGGSVVFGSVPKLSAAFSQFL
jgi:hypothetical protein